MNGKNARPLEGVPGGAAHAAPTTADGTKPRDGPLVTAGTGTHEGGMEASRAPREGSPGLAGRVMPAGARDPGVFTA